MIRSLACLLALGGGGGGGATAATYNASAQFSTLSNTQTSLWSYRFNTTGLHDNNYSLMKNAGIIHTELGAFVTHALGPGSRPQLADPSFPCWYTPAGPDLAPLFCNNGSVNNAIASFRARGTSVFTARVTPAQTLQISPPPQGLAALSFLVPITGTATIIFQFTPNDYSCALPGSGVPAEGIVWSVDKNTEIVTTGKLFSTSAMSLATTGAQNLSFPVADGDRINFTVAPNKGVSNCDSTVLSVSISIL